GQKGARDLSFAEAYCAAVDILEGRATDAQTAAFLMAERMKGESVEELLAFIRALTERNPPPLRPDSGVLDCAGPYDGRSRSFAATIPVAMVLAAAEVPVFLHAPEALPPKNGVSLKAIVRELGLPVGVTSILGGRFTFVDPEELHAPLRALRRIREELGVRTLFNTAEKFLNLAGAKYQITGVFHGTAMDKVVQLLTRLPYGRGMVVQGVDGSEDLPVHRATAVCLVEAGRANRFFIHPEELGLKAEAAPVRLSAAEQAEHTRAILRGEPHPYRNAVLLNSGVRLWLVERVASVQDGVALARSILDSGQAWSILQTLMTSH
ncbi:MAG: anthranilate phosphoribosyltransferase, partial [Alicyclobacillus sp.]|nr:anthranilate phosphoribosyltransferase [Alicyclobacillus sp.]